MKKVLLALSLLASAHAYAQERKGSWSFSAGYTYDHFVNGYVYVREINTVADSLSFNEDLNLSRWHNVSVKLQRTFRNKSSLSLSFEQFFFSSNNKPNKNLYYNALVIDGRAGISIKGSKIMRGLLLYEDPITKDEAKLRLYYTVGLMYDLVLFKIEGQIVNDGDSLNFKEDFNDQVIPAPVIGGKLEWNVCNSSRSLLSLETFGSYIPQNANLFNRAARIKYEHTAINAALGYKFDSGRFFIHPKFVYRHLHAHEDKSYHVFRASTGGVNLEAGIRF